MSPDQEGWFYLLGYRVIVKIKGLKKKKVGVIKVSRESLEILLWFLAIC